MIYQRGKRHPLRLVPFNPTMVLLLSLIFFGFSLTIQACKEDKNDDSYTTAWQLVKKDVFKGELVGKAVYVSSEPMATGEKVKAWDKTYQVPENFPRAWLFFVDDKPQANWQHDCRYIFVNISDGAVKVIKSLTPPDILAKLKKIYPPQD